MKIGEQGIQISMFECPVSHHLLKRVEPPIALRAPSRTGNGLGKLGECKWHIQIGEWRVGIPANKISKSVVVTANKIFNIMHVLNTASQLSRKGKPGEILPERTHPTYIQIVHNPNKI